MTRWLLAGFGFMILLTQCKKTPKTFQVADSTPFGVCYAKVEPSQVENYKMVILEPDFYSKEEITEFQESGTNIIAYVTLGEVDTNRWYFSKLQEVGFRGKNENWNSYYIDLSNTKARQLILNEVIPKIMAKGVDGLFLDTVDAVSPETERGDLQPYMVDLITQIHKLYPDKIIIQNAGLFLLEQTGSSIDAFMTEALASNYDFGSQTYKIRSDSAFNARLGYLQYYVELSNKPYIILDFADTDKNVELIKQRLDTLNRPYFISNIGLSNLPMFPDSVANNLSNGGA